MCKYFILTYAYEFKVPSEKNPAPRSGNFRGPTFSNVNFLLICLTLLLTTHLLIFFNKLNRREGNVENIILDGDFSYYYNWSVGEKGRNMRSLKLGTENFL